MKAKNILSILFALLLVTSCSMEEDIAGDTSKGNTTADAETTALVTFNLNVGNNTKTGNAPTEKDQEIKNTVLFLMEGSQVISVREDATGANPENMKFLVKVSQSESRTFTAMAVVNTSDETRSKLMLATTKDMIDAVTLTASDLALFPKAGTGNVTVEGSKGESTISGKDDAGYYTVPADITVSQRAAGIEIANLSYEYTDGTHAYPIRLAGFSLLNQNESGFIAKCAAFSGKDIAEVTPIKGSGEGTYSNTFYTFANESTTNKTALRLHFVMTVNNKNVDVYKTYTIKHTAGSEQRVEKVVAGCFYSLTIKAVIANNDVDCDFNCTIKDWNNKTITLGEIYSK